MKEHRTKALRVTTPHSIVSDCSKTENEYMGHEKANNLYNTLQILRFQLVSASSNKQPSSNENSIFIQIPQRIANTASATANPVFGRHDSFYSWFSKFENTSHSQPAEEDRRTRHFTRSKCNASDHLSSDENCHCHSSFHKLKLRCKRSLPFDDEIPVQLARYSHSHSVVLDVVSGDLDGNWFAHLRDIQEAIKQDKSYPYSSNWCKMKDQNGNTALLVSGQKLLEMGHFKQAAELAKMLLDEGADVNDTNFENRTLLSYSVQYMDGSLELTKLLLNYGANVWNTPINEELPASSYNRTYDRYGSDSGFNSAFTWFLRAVIGQLKMDENCHQTLHVLAVAMSENPRMMHMHVMSTMFSHAKCYSVLGPLFLQMKILLSPHWTKPQTLRNLCRTKIRKSVLSEGPLNTRSIASMTLPPSLESYVMLDE